MELYHAARMRSGSDRGNRGDIYGATFTLELWFAADPVVFAGNLAHVHDHTVKIQPTCLPFEASEVKRNLLGCGAAFKSPQQFILCRKRDRPCTLKFAIGLIERDAEISGA